MAIHSNNGRRRARSAARTPGGTAAPTVDTTQGPPMQQQPQQPAVPAVLIETDEALRLIYAPHDAAISDARNAGLTAEPFERTAAQKRADAKAKREDAAALVRKAEQQADAMIAEAAEMESAAVQDDRVAQHHRQNEGHFLKVARDIGAAVNFLHTINNKEHPQKLQQRMEQMAAANAQVPDPLNDPIGDLVSASPEVSRTGPLAAAEVSR